MPRKRYEEEHENHERWMVSYADFITLLFAFFVVMYALSTVNEGKYRVLSNSLLSAFGRVTAPPIQGEPIAAPGPIARPTASNPRRGADPMRRETERLTGMARDIQQVLAPLVEQGKVRVTQSPRGVTVEINASVLFAQGDARLSPTSAQALRAVAEVLKSSEHMVQVEGHTDSVPIRNAFFPSNWELSAVRAGSVVRLFVDSGMAENRLSAVGYGPTRAVDSNETEEGRQRNRRVEVLILAQVPGETRELPLPGAR